MDSTLHAGQPDVSRPGIVGVPSRTQAIRDAQRGRRARFAIGSVLGKSFAAWGKDFPTYGLLTLLVFLPYVALVTWANGFEPQILERFWYGLVSSALQPFLSLVLTAMVIHGVFQRLRGKRASLGDCARTGLARILSAVGTSMLGGLAAYAPLLPGIAVLFATRSLGFSQATGEIEWTAGSGWGIFAVLLGVIPMVVIYLGLSVAIPVCVVERPGVRASLRRSWALTKGSKGTLFLLNFVFGLIIGLFSAIVLGIGALTLGKQELWIPLLVTTVLLASVSVVMNAVVYHDLRVAKEGIGSGELAAIFD